MDIIKLHNRNSLRPVLLMLPPQHWLLEGFSSGLTALASFISHRLPDHEIVLLDLSHAHHEELSDMIRLSFQQFAVAPIVGITTTTASYQSALKIAAECKRVWSDCKVVLGGHHTRTQGGLILARHRDTVDFVIEGEGEISLLNLLLHYPNLSQVPGLTYRAEDGFIHQNQPAPLLEQEELDQIDFDFPGLDGNYSLGKFDHVTYVSARGCPLKCSFCAVANERIRAKSISRVIADLRHLVKDQGYSSIAIEDNFFAHSPARTFAICEAISALQKEEHLDFQWDCQTRVESLRRVDIIKAMSKANCEAVYLGVEALDEASLIYLGKTLHPQSYLDLLQERVVPQLMLHNLDCYINLQLGVPGQIEQAHHRTLARLSRLGKIARSHGKEITIFPQLHVVYPGTEHFRKGVPGRFPEDVFESFTEWEYHETPIRRFLGREFAHGTGGIPEGILMAESLRAGQNYEPDGKAVIKIVDQLQEMKELPGIRVFEYGRYLVKDYNEASALDSSDITEIPWSADSEYTCLPFESRTKKA